MRVFILSFFAAAFGLAACGTTTAGDGGALVDVAVDASADVAGTDAPDAAPDAMTDAIDTELPQVDATSDVADVAKTDAAVDAGTDAVLQELPPADAGPDVASNGCCQTDSDCQKGNVCIPGKDCVPSAPSGSCWFDSDCTSGKCENALVCPCTADCSFSYSFGKCSDNVGSCCGGTKGGCLNGEVCVGNQVCKPAKLPSGSCWSNADCPGGTCQGATVCPCGAMCLVGDKPGLCTSP